jgi:hypothetical protein
MECNHDPFTLDSTLSFVPVIGGTDLICRVCNSMAAFDVLGQLHSVQRMPTRHYGDVAGTFADLSNTYQAPPAEHIVLDGESARWRCDFGVEHDLGEHCACTHA